MSTPKSMQSKIFNGVQFKQTARKNWSFRNTGHYKNLLKIQPTAKEWASIKNADIYRY